MYITRGTTPVHIFALPLSIDRLHDVLVTYSQGNNSDPIISKSWVTKSSTTNSGADDNINVSGVENNPKYSQVEIALKANETAAFDPKQFIRFQVSYSEIFTAKDGTVTSGDVYKSDIIYLAVVDDLANPYVEQQGS